MSKCIKLELPADLSVEPCAIGEPVDWTKLQVLATYEDNTQTTLPVTPRMLNESSLQTTASVRKSIIICRGPARANSNPHQKHRSHRHRSGGQ